MLRGLRGLLTGTGTPEPAEPPAGVSPENMVWIFGAGRTGSTWLAGMM